MLYTIAQFVKKHHQPLWIFVERLNATLFSLRYGLRLRDCDTWLQEYHLRRATTADAERLAAFFAAQPEEAFRYFRPHDFDAATLRRLLSRSSWIIYVAEEQGEIVGYGFLRAFFIGKSYLGKMVDHQHQGRGIAQRLCLAGMSICTHIGLRMFESINRQNLASLHSSQKVLRTQVVAELHNGDLLIEDFPL